MPITVARNEGIQIILYVSLESPPHHKGVAVLIWSRSDAATIRGSFQPVPWVTVRVMGTIYYVQIDDSPVGPLLLAGNNDGLHVLAFGVGSRPRPIDPSWQLDTKGALTAVRKELDEYFSGRLRKFTTPLAFEGRFPLVPQSAEPAG